MVSTKFFDKLIKSTKPKFKREEIRGVMTQKQTGINTIKQEKTKNLIV